MRLGVPGRLFFNLRWFPMPAQDPDIEAEVGLESRGPTPIIKGELGDPAEAEIGVVALVLAVDGVSDCIVVAEAGDGANTGAELGPFA